MILIRGARRSDGCAVGGAGAAVAEGQEAGPAGDMDPATTDRRHTVADPNRDAVAGCSGAVRALGPGVRPVPPLAARRYLAADLYRAAGPGRRPGPDHLGPQRRLHHRPGPPARCRGKEKGDLQKEPPGGIVIEPDDHGLGRSRGGLTTKLHLAAEQGQKPMSIVVTAGQRGDSPQFEPVLDKVRVPRMGPGRPRTRPDRVRADKAYASRKNSAYLRRRRIRCTIPDKADQARNRKKFGSRGGRPPKFDPEDYKARHAVECGINPAEAAPGRRHAIRQTCCPLRSDIADRRHQRMAVTGTRPRLKPTPP